MHPGFNHNIKYRGRIYHIQTEDSGIKNPHIITHLFVGGNIIESVKTEYRHLLSDKGSMEMKVVEMMKGQHKEMMRKLINGSMDAKLGLPREDPVEAAKVPPSERAELVGGEDEGQLFMGVISEKSLDEVILSFLSDEDKKDNKD